MRKGLVLPILVMILLVLFSANTTLAVDPNVSVQPQLVQDNQIKPNDPPLESHPTSHDNTAYVTDPGNAYDNDHLTSSFTNITEQPYPSKYSRPTANSGNVTVTNAGYAYDMNQLTFASVAVTGVGMVPPSIGEFSVQTFNSTAITAVSSVDLRINYTLTVTPGDNCSYQIVLYVGTQSVVLVDRNWTTTNLPDPTLEAWTNIDEPNDGVWSVTDLNNMRISFETQVEIKQDVGTLKVYEVWALVYPPNIAYFAVETFAPTAISGFSYLSVQMNFTSIVGGCSYRILVGVGSASTTLQSWTGISQVTPQVISWERVTEPNDGWWNQSDLSNMRINVETQRTKSPGSGTFTIYEVWALISPPTVNSYPGNHEGTATVSSPTLAYDKNQMTYASISAPSTTATYFAVKAFNVTTLNEYATINIQMRYNVTTWNSKYRIYLYIGTTSLNLQILTNTNQTEPIVRTWVGVCEPNDGVWSAADISNMQIRVEVRKTLTTGTCTFQEYDTWVTIPEDSFTIRAHVSGVLVSLPLYAWQFNLTFNKDVLQVESVSEGPFLKQAGVTSLAGVSIDNDIGWVFVGCALDDWYGGGADGSGVLATVTFKTVAKGNSMLNFSETQLRSFDDINEIVIVVTHTNSPGWFQYLGGDVNGDAAVNITDLYQLGEAYGTTSGSPGYNADADQDKDGDVDANDLAIVSANYGAT